MDASAGLPEGDPTTAPVALDTVAVEADSSLGVPAGGGAAATSSSFAVLDVAETRVQVVPGQNTTWRLDELNGRQVDFVAYFLPPGGAPPDNAARRYGRHTRCYGQHLAEAEGQIALCLSNEFSWRNSKLVNMHVGTGAGAGSHAAPAAARTPSALMRATAVEQSAEGESSLKAVVEDLGAKLADARSKVGRLTTVNGELSARLAFGSQGDAALRAEVEQLRAQVASTGAGGVGSVHDLLVAHGLEAFEDKLRALGASAPVHLAQLDESDIAQLGVSDSQRTAFEAMLAKCEPPPMVEDSLVRVSSAAEKRSQAAREELTRQSSNKTNPAAAAAAASAGGGGSDADILTRVNTMVAMAASMADTPAADGEGGEPEPEGERDCSICMEAHDPSMGVRCSGDSPHYVCLSCLCLYIEGQCEPSAAGGTYEIEKRNAGGHVSDVGELPCPVFLMDGCDCGRIGGEEAALMMKVASHPSCVRTLKTLIGASQRAAREKERAEQAEVADAEARRKAAQTALQAAGDLVKEAMTHGQSTSCPKCSATFRKDDQCMHMTCEICRTDFCYVCGKDSRGCVRGRDCDRQSCFLESNPGWGDHARAGESRGEGALYEFQRRKIAFLVRQAKEKIEDEVWTRLKTDEPELLTDVIKGRSITWEEVDSAEMPQFGERPPEAGPPGAPDATGFAAGMRVRVVVDPPRLQQLADGFGGWNPRMAEVCGRVGVVEHTNGTWVSVAFGETSWALNPAAIQQVEGADADDRDEDDLDFEDLLELVGHEGLMELGELDEGALEARLDELLGQARRARAARRGGPGGPPPGPPRGAPPPGPPPGDPPRGGFRVGARVRLRPGSGQRGCLRGGAVGTLVEDDGSDVPYKCEHGGETYWYAAPDIIAADDPGAAPTFSRGDRVRVIADVGRARGLAEGMGGWNDDMAAYCGREGTVQRVGRQGAVQVAHDGGRSWFWSPEALESTAAEGGVARRPSTGDRVRLAPGETEGCLARDGSREGVIVEDDHSHMPFKVECGGDTYWYRENQVVLARPQVARGGGTQVREGDPVTIIADVPRARQLADGHGGWVDSMARYCGQSGVVRSVDGDGDVAVQFRDGQNWTWNPACIVGGGGTRPQRPTTGDLVQIRRGRDPRGLNHTESFRIVRDDHDGTPYRLKSNTPGDEDTYGWFTEADLELMSSGGGDTPIRHTAHPHPLVICHRGGWICDICRTSEPDGDRHRCAEGCDYDICAACWPAGVQEAAPSAEPPAEGPTSFVVQGAGGVGRRCNGTYMQQPGRGHNDRPTYSQVGGRGLIYWNNYWKMVRAPG